MALVVWSISKWRDFESCRAMFKAKHITKTWVDAPSPALENGRRVHKAFEEAVKYGVQLPPEFVSFEPALEVFEGRRDVLTEYKFGLTRDMTHCEFFAEDVWIRGALDLFVAKRDNPLFIDYKTGRRKQEHESDCEFYGAAVSAAYRFPRIVGQYWYVDDPKQSFARVVDDGAPIMERWAALFDAAQGMIDQDKMPPDPGPQCRWCGFAGCPHNRNEKLK